MFHSGWFSAGNSEAIYKVLEVHACILVAGYDQSTLALQVIRYLLIFDGLLIVVGLKFLLEVTGVALLILAKQFLLKSKNELPELLHSVVLHGELPFF